MLSAHPARSRHAFGIKLHPDTAETVDAAYLHPMVAKFMSARGISDYAQLDYNEAFYIGDFAGPGQFSIDFFYDLLFSDMSITFDRSTSEPTAKQRHRVKYLLTLDAREGSKRCPVTNWTYSSLDLAGEPIAFIICLPISELLDAIRTAASAKGF